MYYPKNKFYQLETHPSSIPFSQVIVSELVRKSPLYIRFLGPSSQVSGPTPGIACLQPLRVSNYPVVALSHTPRLGRIFWGVKMDGGTVGSIWFISLCKRWPLWKGHMLTPLGVGNVVHVVWVVPRNASNSHSFKEVGILNLHVSHYYWEEGTTSNIVITPKCFSFWFCWPWISINNASSYIVCIHI